MQFNFRHFQILQLEKLALFNLAYFCHPPIKPKFPSRQNYPVYILGVCVCGGGGNHAQRTTTHVLCDSQLVYTVLVPSSAIYSRCTTDNAHAVVDRFVYYSTIAFYMKKI